MTFTELNEKCSNAFNVIESEQLIAEWLQHRVNEAIHINLRVNGGNDSPFTNKLLEIDKVIVYVKRQLDSELIDSAIK